MKIIKAHHCACVVVGKILFGNFFSYLTVKNDMLIRLEVTSSIQEHFHNFRHRNFQVVGWEVDDSERMRTNEWRNCIKFTKMYVWWFKIKKFSLKLKAKFFQFFIFSFLYFTHKKISTAKAETTPNLHVNVNLSVISKE